MTPTTFTSRDLLSVATLLDRLDPAPHRCTVEGCVHHLPRPAFDAWK
jgi:hypothetical protein